MLKYQTNEVPEGLEAYYENAGDFYQLKVEGVVPQSKYDEEKKKVKDFRDRNTTLLKENDELNAFKDVLGDGEKLSAQAINKKIEEKATERAQKVVADLKADYETKLTTLTTDLTAKTQRLNSLTLGDEVRKAGTKHGVRKTAFDDVMLRVERDWTVGEDGRLQLKSSKLSSDGRTIETIDDYIADTLKAAPHLAEPTQGNGIKPTARSTTFTKATENASAIDKISAGISTKAHSTVPRSN